MRRTLVALTILASVSAHAADVPQGSDRDNRIQYVNYSDRDVVVVHARVGYVSRIVFAPGEKILNAVAGLDRGWIVTPIDNALWIKPQSVQVAKDKPPVSPTAGDWNTNIVVRTNQRLYDIELRLLEEGQSGIEQAFYRVQFQYPVEEKAIAEAEELKRAASERQQARTAPRNWQFKMTVGKRSDAIAPNMAYDDGTFTYLRFPASRDMPTVFLQEADGTESVVNTHINPEFPDILVVHRVAETMLLRLGKKVVAIYNQQLDLNTPTSRSGTTVPGLKRTVKGGSL